MEVALVKQCHHGYHLPMYTWVHAQYFYILESLKLPNFKTLYFLFMYSHVHGVKMGTEKGQKWA